MAFQANEAEFRRIERETLDTFHQRLALHQRDRAEARLGVLAAYDSITLPSLVATLAGREPDPSKRQLEKKFEEGLSQAMRWLSSGGERVSVRGAISRELLDQAGEYILHAADYAGLADFHRLVGARLVEAQVDVDARRIRFSYAQPESGFQAALGFISSIEHELLRRPTGALKKVDGNPLEGLQFDLADGRILLRNPDAVVNTPFDPALDLPAPPDVIDDAADLGGFSAAAFRSYWQGLLRWGVPCLMRFLRLALRGTPQETCMPTQIVPVNTFRDVMVGVSGLDVDTVHTITQRLRYDHRTQAPDIFQQPLLIDDDAVAWSPHLTLMSRYQRNMLRLMARTRALKPIADNLIGGREREVLNRFGQLLQRQGWAYKLNQRVTAAGREGEIDLLGYSSRDRSEVLIVEWKSILTVDEVHEVRTATAELQRAQQQAMNCVEILRAMPNEERRRLYPFVNWNQVTALMPLVVTQDVEPNEQYDHARVPALSVASLQTYGRSRDMRGPARLCEFARDRQWYARYRDMTHEYDEIQVGDVTYEVPMLVREYEEGS